ncbi:MAG: DMT family transporter [Lentisphaerae bacterium]|nr:DMT family transporter [Lentisphaerota bacterium]
MRNKTACAILALFGALVCWSSVPLFLRHFATLPVPIDAWTVNGVRYCFAALILLPATIAGSRKQMPPGRNIWLDALVPAAINAAGQVGWALIPYHAEASVIAFGIRSAFLFAVLGGFWLLPDERYLLRSPAFWLGSAICIGGVVALFRGTLKSGTSLVGCALILGTAVVWGFYMVTARRFMKDYSAHHSFGVISFYTAVALGILTLGIGDTTRLATLGAVPILLLLVSAFVGIVCAHVLVYYAMGRLGALISSGGQFISPFLTFAGAALLFGERLSAWQWLGGISVVAGGVAMIAAHRSRDREELLKLDTD